MYTKLLLVFLITVTATKAQSNDVCLCDSKDNMQEKKLLDTLLEKLSTDVDDKHRNLYSVYPGLLSDYDCNCEKQRTKRKTEVEQPMEQPTEQDPEPEEVEKRSIHAADRRCPKGSVRFAFTCVPVNDFDDY